MNENKPTCPGDCTSRVAVLESQMLDVRETLHEIVEKIDKVLVQTTKTNGSVVRLQDDVKEIKAEHSKLETRTAELEKGNVKLWLIVGAAASLISTLLPIGINKLL